ncbi:hypothetical protein J14TS2_35730 [Bacillus sp. J14TS2]|uniref:stage II sporulation protein P n=1 Tax=Bacillus sp. J14TS2 TaxID=2807188 RepID=UPI001B16E835|nr:stage II sporulation protein P [Bacillus sp. J14TS2]GIN73098.1 hypothetical protein J14TS2_35730 [Bacillus sp. J14TS2]
MRSEKEIFKMMKETYPQNPSDDFIVTTENKLRQKARNMNKKKLVYRISILSSGALLFLFAFSWLFLFNEKEITFNSLGKEVFSSTGFENNEASVFIYHSHNHEKFEDGKDITLVGKELSRLLNENNIKTIHDDTDIAGIIKKRNLSIADSYTVSREILKETLDNHKNMDIVFDIHRDSSKRADTTVTLNGKDYAKIVFMVSNSSDHYEENQRFATHLNEKLEELYPGLSRGVVIKSEKTQNTYNQDLRDHLVLLEIGGTENTLEESYRTTAAFAEVIKEIMEN